MPMTFHGPSVRLRLWRTDGRDEAGTVERPIAAGRAALRDSRVHSKTRRKSRWKEGGSERGEQAWLRGRSVAWSVRASVTLPLLSSSLAL